MGWLFFERSDEAYAIQCRKAPIECQQSQSADECATRLQSAGKNPFDAFGYEGEEITYGGGCKPSRVNALGYLLMLFPLTVGLMALYVIS